MKVKVSRRCLVRTLVVLALAVPAAYVINYITRAVVFLAGVFVFTKKWLRKAERGRARLFLETDYEELLAACRELLNRLPAEGGGRHYKVHLGKRDPATLTFPRVILDLEPALVHILPVDHEVLIELFPGPEWFGLIASAEGHEGHGNVKLIDGLWYCDTRYRNEYPEYVKQINAMIEEGRRIKEKRESAQTP